MDFWAHAKNNWMTSLAGAPALVTGSVDVLVAVALIAHIPLAGITTTMTPAELLYQGLPLLSTGLMGLLAKDFNVTGGTKQQ